MGRPPINPEGAMSASERKARSRQMGAHSVGRLVQVNLDDRAAAALDKILETGRAKTTTEAISLALRRAARNIRV